MPLPKGANPTENAKIKEWLKGRWKFPSGFCNEHGKPGQHEGQKPKDWRGSPLPTCPSFEQCPCNCHYQIGVMFSIGGMDRQEMNNSGYIPFTSEIFMPLVADPITGAIASTDGGPITSPRMEDALEPAPVASATPLVERRTPLGYAGRGTLEAQVWDACKWFDDNSVTATTLAVAEWIVNKYKVPTPSRGAIQAVWVRWDKINFASLEKGPVRFTGYTGAGTWEELERIKTSSKSKKKQEQGAVKRGQLRPRK